MSLLQRLWRASGALSILAVFAVLLYFSTMFRYPHGSVGTMPTVVGLIQFLDNRFFAIELNAALIDVVKQNLFPNGGSPLVRLTLAKADAQQGRLANAVAAHHTGAFAGPQGEL